MRRGQRNVETAGRPRISVSGRCVNFSILIYPLHNADMCGYCTACVHVATCPLVQSIKRDRGKALEWTDGCSLWDRWDDWMEASLQLNLFSPAQFDHSTAANMQKPPLTPKSLTLISVRAPLVRHHPRPPAVQMETRSAVSSLLMERVTRARGRSECSSQRGILSAVDVELHVFYSLIE